MSDEFKIVPKIDLLNPSVEIPDSAEEALLHNMAIGVRRRYAVKLKKIYEDLREMIKVALENEN